MIALRRSDERGAAQFGWLDSKHTFSFGHYHDPQFMGFGPLRVINEDRVAPSAGFPTHGHANMEIISYVLDGALEHKDSLGTGATIRPGEVQRMTAGTGIRHSEYNASKTEPVHFLQIWIEPAVEGLKPGYEQKAFDVAATPDRLRLVASRDGREGSVTVHQNVDLYAVRLTTGGTVEHRLAPGHRIWVQVARGAVEVNGEALVAGDGAAMAQEAVLTLVGSGDQGAEVLVFDMTD